MKPVALAAALAFALAAPAAAAPQSTDPFFGPRTHYGLGPWLADFGAGPPLGVSEVVVAFAEGREPLRAVVGAITPKGSPAYVKAGMVARGPDAPPRAVALKVDVPTLTPILALRALGPQHRLVGSAPPKPGAGAPLARILADARVARGKDTLVHVRRYHAPRPPEIVDVFVGEPTWDRARKAMHAVAVKRLTLVGARVASTKRYTRRTGAIEHVDTPPVALTAANWHEPPTATLGFVGLADGRWFRLTADQGFEGVAYRVEQVGSGSVVYDAYHYTPH